MTSKANAKVAPKKLKFRKETLKDLSVSRIGDVKGGATEYIRETVLVVPTSVGNPPAGIPSIVIRNR